MFYMYVTNAYFFHWKAWAALESYLIILINYIILLYLYNFFLFLDLSISPINSPILASCISEALPFQNSIIRNEFLCIQMDFYFQNFSNEMPSVLEKVILPAGLAITRHSCHLSSLLGLCQTWQNWSRSSFPPSPDATLKCTAQVSCYELITVCPSVEIYLLYLFKILSVKERR